MEESVEHTRAARWSEEEDGLLRKYYPSCGSNIPGLNRSAPSIHIRAKRLGIRRTLSWSPQEDKILKEYYLSEGRLCASRIPGKSKSAVAHRAETLGLPIVNLQKKQMKYEDTVYSSIREACAAAGVSASGYSSWCRENSVIVGERLDEYVASCKRTLWTEDEDEVLRKFYPIEGQDVAHRLPGRTVLSVRTRAQLLGIRSKRCAPWSEVEVSELICAVEECRIPNLPGRTASSIEGMRKRLGLTINATRVSTLADVLRCNTAGDGYVFVVCARCKKVFLLNLQEAITFNHAKCEDLVPVPVGWKLPWTIRTVIE